MVTNKGLDFYSDAVKIVQPDGDLYIIVLNCDTVKMLGGIEQGVFGRLLALKHIHAAFVRANTAWLGDAETELPSQEQGELIPLKHFYIQLTA